MNERQPMDNVQTSADERGWVSNLLDFLPVSSAQLKNVHLVEMKPGTVRGNHRHRVQTEWIVICGGPCLVVTESEDQRSERYLTGDQPMMLTLPPGVAHAVQYNGDHRAYLVCLTDTPYNFQDPDVERITLIE